MSEEITPFQVTPKTPLAGSAASDIREQGEISRRKFPFVLTSAWLLLTAALGGLGGILGRFMFPNVLFEPVQKFKAGPVNDYSVGEVDERWKEKFGVWLVRTEEHDVCADHGRARTSAARRTGCRRRTSSSVPATAAATTSPGINFEGPTPRPLERAKISIDPSDGQIVVDKSVQFHQERGEWTHPDSFLKI